MQSFAQTHVVGKNAAEAERGQMAEEVEAILLVRTHFRLQTRREFRGGNCFEVFEPVAKSLGLWRIGKAAQTSFVEAKDTHTWKIYFAGFLKMPLNDLEYAIKLYDISGKGQQLLVSFDQFTDERGQKTIVSNMTLDKKQVGVNKELLMVMESRGKVLASSRFKILGEGEKFTGKVNFTEDEANGKTTDE